MLEHPYPNNIKAEEALLGVMLVTPDAAGVGFETIKSEDYFFKPAHQTIFKAMQELYEKERSIDPIILATALENKQELEAVGGEVEITRLHTNAPAPSHAKDYAEVVRSEYIRRRLILAAEQVKSLVQENRDSEMHDLIDEAEGIIYNATEDRLTQSTHKLHLLLDQALERYEYLYDNPATLLGAETGFYELDDTLLGLQRQNLIVVGARPSIGKTSFALNIAARIAQKEPVLFFSLEMAAEEITKRIVSMLSKIPSPKLSKGNLETDDWENIARVMEVYRNTDFYIDDNPGLTVLEIKAKARRLKAELNNRLGAVFVDYMQLMTAPGAHENRQVEVSTISRGLKVLARELDCPVIALSQLSRGVEARGDKRPMLADLRESGSIEQDADVVIFLYRDDVYKRESQNQNVVEVNVAKHRSGGTGFSELVFISDTTRFLNKTRTTTQMPPEAASLEQPI